MKKNMKKLLVIVMALMPSLSIFAMNPNGFDLMPEPDDIPIIPHPGTGGPGPRIMSVGPNDIPITPDPNVGGGGGPRIQSNEPDDIPIKSNPGTGVPVPRIMSVGDGGSADDGGLIDLGFGGVHPRQDIDPNEIPIKPAPSPNPNPGHEPRIRSIVQDPQCYHYNGVVYIEADSIITYINASVTRQDDGLVWSNAASGNTLSITTSDASGVYYLELTLSSGQSYIGKYIIE